MSLTAIDAEYDALHEDLDVVIIGGGFGGMLAEVRLQEPHPGYRTRRAAWCAGSYRPLTASLAGVGLGCRQSNPLT